MTKDVRQQNRGCLERWRVDRGDRPLRELQHRHLQSYINKLSTPHVQRNVLRAIRHFLKFALKQQMVDNDASAGVQKRKLPKGGGFRPWEESHVSTYMAKHPVGTTAHLAMQLMLCTSLRRSDAVQIGPRHVQKTEKYPLGIIADYLPQNATCSRSPRSRDTRTCARCSCMSTLATVRRPQARPWAS